MKSAFALIAFSLIFSTHQAIAQTSPSTSGESKMAAPLAPKSWGLKVDGSSLLLKGFGLGVGHSFSEKINTSVFYSQHSLESKDDTRSVLGSLGSYNAVHRAQEYGLRADFYPFASFDRGGFYTSVLAVKINLKTTVDPIFSDEIRVLNASKSGLRLIAGYEFKRGFLKRLSSALNIGLGYGAGGAYGNNLGGTKNEINDSLHLDAAYSFLF